MSELTAARLREVVNYDPETGIFTNKLARQGTQVGAVLGTNSRGYLVICVDCTLYQAHRLAWLYVNGEWPPEELDHKDKIRHHNWIDNLRPATHGQNSANTNVRAHNKSGVKGVNWDSDRQLWRARITKDRKGITLGRFPTPEEAHAAYVAAADRLFGEFARSA